MKLITKILFRIFLFFIFIFSVNAQNSVTLRRSFVDSLKNSVSVKVNFIVDTSHRRPNLATDDGDMHIAGRSDQIGLPIVAEIMNAKDFSHAVNLVHQIQGTGDNLKMTGIWRLWLEHPHGSQRQVDNLTKLTGTNPAHVFEIHPVLKIENLDLTSSLKPIKGYKPSVASKAFDSFLKTTCIINFDDKHITIDSKKRGNNYVKFVMEIVGNELNVVGGSFVNANVFTTRKKKIAENVRMVFSKDSEPEKEFKKLSQGDKMLVLGIPRVNLNDVVKLVEGSPNNMTINSKLPFEMIIVGVYDN